MKNKTLKVQEKELFCKKIKNNRKIYIILPTFLFCFL